MIFAKPLARHVARPIGSRATIGLTLRYLCDGGCKPNPGRAQPVVYDGRSFIRVRSQRNGTNHRAIYSGIIAALRDAQRRQAKAVEIHLFSKLAYLQLTDSLGVNRMAFYVSRTLRLANRFSEVTWVLVTPPAMAAGVAINSKRAFRNLAAKRLAAGRPKLLSTPATAVSSGPRTP